MTTTSAAAILDYTRSGYRHINRNLLKGVVTPEAEALTNALSELPAVAATTFRSINIDEIEAYYASISGKKEISFPTFLSTSRAENKARQFGGNVFFTIEGKTGRDIQAYSDAPSEQEVLLPTNCQFTIKKIKTIKVAGKVFKLEITLIQK